MPRKIKSPDEKTKKPLIERQRELWKIAEAIEIAQHRNQPLGYELSKYLWMALHSICRGEDANEVLEVMADQGVRKDGFRKEMHKKLVIGAISTATQSETPKKTRVAIDEVTNALPLMKKATARKTWNSKLTDRKPHFSFGKK